MYFSKDYLQANIYKFMPVDVARVFHLENRRAQSINWKPHFLGPCCKPFFKMLLYNFIDFSERENVVCDFVGRQIGFDAAPIQYIVVNLSLCLRHMDLFVSITGSVDMVVHLAGLPNLSYRFKIKDLYFI
jgi:hypothetical protein